MFFHREDDLRFLLAWYVRAMRRRLMSQLDSLGVTYEQFRGLTPFVTRTMSHR